MKKMIRLVKDWQNGPTHYAKGQLLQCAESDAQELMSQGICELYGQKNQLNRRPLAQYSDSTCSAMSPEKFWLGKDYAGDNGSDDFNGTADFLKAVVAAKNGHWDERLGTKDVSEGVSTEGGFLVPTDFSREVWREIYLSVPLLLRAMLLPVDGSGIKVPFIGDTNRSTTGMHGINPPQAAEASALTDISPTFGQCSLTLHKIGGRCRVSNEMLEDSASAMSILLPSVFSDALRFEIENQLLRGSGAGECLGVLNAPCTITTAKEAGQTADTIDFENIVKMWSRLTPTAQRKCIWVASPDTIPQLYSMSLNVGTAGSHVFLPRDHFGDSASAPPPSTIFGRPLFFSECAPKLGDEGDVMVFNPEAYAIAKKSGGLLRIDTSEQARFENDQTVFRAIARLDGQPLQSAPITPRNGGATVSNFVKLAERA